jgi:hypothetical protein
MVANRPRRRLGTREAEIHVVDREDLHVYHPASLSRQTSAFATKTSR